MIGKTLDHYQIVEKLGEGGMGEVYRSRDTKLNRDVALKVLPETFAADRERLWSEERVSGHCGSGTWNLLPNGLRTVIAPVTGNEVPASINLILVTNFFNELRHRVPVGSGRQSVGWDPSIYS
jgi:serine/threonine protein kinase